MTASYRRPKTKVPTVLSRNSTSSFYSIGSYLDMGTHSFRPNTFMAFFDCYYHYYILYNGNLSRKTNGNNVVSRLYATAIIIIIDDSERMDVCYVLFFPNCELIYSTLIALTIIDVLYSDDCFNRCLLIKC